MVRPMKRLIVWALLPMFFLQVQAQETEAGEADEKPCACCTEKHMEFDFWVGDWNTYGPKGNLAGTNHIVKLQDQCIIQENWASEGFPYTGTSYNFYDSGSDEWIQVWIDNQGGNLLLRGGLVDGNMVLKSEAKQAPGGGSDLNRITWTPNADGTVRQHWETSRDFGQTWSTLFDGHYKKKSNQ